MRNRSESAKNRARAYRRLSSGAEYALWKRIKNGGLGYEVKRQHPIDKYFLDFYIDSLKLCLEVDGEGHALQAAYDQKRDERLRKFGIDTLRIGTYDIGKDLDMVLENLRMICDLRAEALELKQQISRPPENP